MTECPHRWIADHFHSGFGCRVCGASYWDWSQAEIKTISSRQNNILVALKCLQDDIAKLERIVSP